MADTIHATTISNCGSGSISQIEYWNIKLNDSQYYGYWKNGNDVKNFMKLELNGSLLVSLQFF